MKTAYIICNFLLDLFLLSGAVLIPVYVTPGYYWWSAIFIVLLFAAGESLGQRLDQWR